MKRPVRPFGELWTIREILGRLRRFWGDILKVSSNFGITWGDLESSRVDL